MCECVQFNCVFTGAKPLGVRSRAERVIFISLGLCLCADLPAGSSCKLCVDNQKCANVEIGLYYQESNIKKVLENIWHDKQQRNKQRRDEMAPA